MSRIRRVGSSFVKRGGPSGHQGYDRGALLGLVFFGFGLNGLLHVFPLPPAQGAAAVFIGGLIASRLARSRLREIIRQWPNQTEVTVNGSKLLQKDSPDDRGGDRGLHQENEAT